MISKKIILATALLYATSTFSSVSAQGRYNILNRRSNINENPIIIMGADGEKESVVGYGEKKYNEIGLTPQMGWSSWNYFKEKIDEQNIMEIAEAMSKSGLLDAGYEYLNLDDAWQSSMRDENQRLQADITNFPSGMKNVIENINELGLKVGLYTSNGDYTCLDLPASQGYERIDAETFADWGVEYFKYDYCHNVQLSKYAPDIDRIYIGKQGEYDSLTAEAEDARLIGGARVAESYESYGGKYVTGLSNANGEIIFENINVDSDGEYILTVGLKKSIMAMKYLEIEINGEDIYSTEVAPSPGYNYTGRQQLKVNLKEGNNIIRMYNPIRSEKDSAKRLYDRMGQELKRATKNYAELTGEPEKEIFYSVCEWGTNRPWEWGNGVANSWRTTHDIYAEWNRVMEIYSTNVELYEYAGPGAWNDPDMLEVGNGNLTYDENKSHFSLWCMMAAPLILGNDVRTFIKEDGTVDIENETLQILTNKDMIAIDQDIKGVQGRIVKRDGNVDILVKPLQGGDLAITLFNKGDSTTTAKVEINDLIKLDFVELELSDTYKAYEVWDKTIERTDNVISASIPSHGVKVYRVSPGKAGEVDKEQSFSLDINPVIEPNKTLQVSTEFRNTGIEEIKDISVSLNLPQEFIVEPINTTIDKLVNGDTFIASWNVIVPDVIGSFDVKSEVEFKYDTESESRLKTIDTTIRTMNVPDDNSKLGDIEWYYSRADWGNVERNMNTGKGPIVLSGKTYQSGMGTHANGETQIFLGGNPYNFKAIVGIDDSTNGGEFGIKIPTVTFEILADGKRIYETRVLGYKELEEIDIDIVDCQMLTLKTTDAKDGNAYDWANWADGTFNALDDVNISLDSYQIVEQNKEVIISNKIENLGETAIENLNATLNLPESFEVTEIDVTRDIVNPGESFYAKWKVQTPNEKNEFELNTSIEYNQYNDINKKTGTYSTIIKTMPVPSENSKLGDIEWYKATAAWGGAVRRNTTIKDTPLRINGKEYESGMGTHANGETQIFLGGKPYNFTCIVGIDDATNGGNEITSPSVVFEVVADGVTLFNSGVLRYRDQEKIDLEITDCQMLTLRTIDARDGNGFDESNWVDGIFKVIDDSENIDKTTLLEAMNLATELIDNSVEGMEVGNYHKGSKDMLNGSLESAKVIYDNEQITEEEVNLATESLKVNIEKFKALLITDKTGDIDGDGVVYLKDLAIVSKYYGEVKEDDEMSRNADINKDGVVGEYDISFISMRILKWR